MSIVEPERFVMPWVCNSNTTTSDHYHTLVQSCFDMAVMAYPQPVGVAKAYTLHAMGFAGHQWDIILPGD